MAVRPTPVRPTTVRPTTVRPTTVRPTTVRPTTVRPTIVSNGMLEGLLKINRSHGGQHWFLPSPSPAARWHRRLAKTRVPHRASRLLASTPGQAGERLV